MPDALDTPVTLTFDLLTSRSMHAERLIRSTFVPSLVLIVYAVFLLEHGQTDTDSRVTLTFDFLNSGSLSACRSTATLALIAEAGFL